MRCPIVLGGRISHRPALLAYHDTLLAIGDGKCGFTLSTIERFKSQLVKVVGRSHAARLLVQGRKPLELGKWPATMDSRRVACELV